MERFTAESYSRRAPQTRPQRAIRAPRMPAEPPHGSVRGTATFTETRVAGGHCGIRPKTAREVARGIVLSSGQGSDMAGGTGTAGTSQADKRRAIGGSRPGNSVAPQKHQREICQRTAEHHKRGSNVERGEKVGRHKRDAGSADRRGQAQRRQRHPAQRGGTWRHSPSTGLWQNYQGGSGKASAASAIRVPHLCVKMALLAFFCVTMEKAVNRQQTLYPSAFQSDPAPFLMAALLGFEPRQNDSESFVLPLHHKAKCEGENYGGSAACK